MNNYNKLEYTLPYYFLPFVSSVSISTIISARSNWGPYNVQVEGIHAILLGVVSLLFVIFMTYDFLISKPKSIGGEKKSKKIIKRFLSSSFFYLWSIVIFTEVFYKIFGLKFLFYLYFIFLLICFKTQFDFFKKIHDILEMDS